jgi:hypothetical protein
MHAGTKNTKQKLQQIIETCHYHYSLLGFYFSLPYNEVKAQSDSKIAKFLLEISSLVVL